MFCEKCGFEYEGNSCPACEEATKAAEQTCICEKIEEKPAKKIDVFGIITMALSGLNVAWFAISTAALFLCVWSLPIIASAFYTLTTILSVIGILFIGIISLPLFCPAIVSLCAYVIGLIPTIATLVVSFIAKKKNPESKFSGIGNLLAIIGTILRVALIAVCALIIIVAIITFVLVCVIGFVFGVISAFLGI